MSISTIALSTHKELESARIIIQQQQDRIDKLEQSHEIMTYIIQKAAHRRCDYCIFKTEPCPARGLNAECNFEYAEVD